MPTTKPRKSLTLDADTEARLRRFTADQRLMVAVRRHAPGEIASESALLATVFRIGLEAVEREADELRYAALAAVDDDDDREFHAAMRTRRAARR